MLDTKNFTTKHSLPIIIVMIAQFACAMFFASDAVYDSLDLSSSPDTILHLITESIAAVVLIISIAFEYKLLAMLVKRKVQLERSLSESQQSLNQIMEEQFERWGLTPAEFDVATYLFQGLPLNEIAIARTASAGTIKSQLSAIYRKAGVQSRAELLMIVIDSIYSTEKI